MRCHFNPNPNANNSLFFKTQNLSQMSLILTPQKVFDHFVWGKKLQQRLKRSALLLTGALLPALSIAQTTDVIDSLLSSPSQQFSLMTQSVDMQSATTGLMLDQAMPFEVIANYDGQALTADNMATTFNFCKMYAMLSSMSINTNQSLPHPSAYTSAIEAVPKSEIHLGVLHYNYNQFRDDALTLNLLSTDGAQFFDVPNRPFDPIISNEVFLAAPSRQRSNSLATTFKLPSNLYFTNSNKVVSSVLVDFGNGQGTRQVSVDQAIPVNYTSFGTKEVIVTINFTDLTSLTAHCKFQIVDTGIPKYNFTPDLELSLTADKGFSTPDGPFETGSATISVFYACGHENIQKPLIWVEGFNPTVDDLPIDYGHGMMKAILGTGNFGGTSIRDLCDQQGYDLIYVDFEDGGDWIQKNAFVVQKVIKWANQQKAQNGSNEQNLVIGESMGGVVARYALRDMELEGVNHDTKTYMSLDSPHQGANVPLSAQYAAKHIPYINIAGVPLYIFLPSLEFVEMPDEILITPTGADAEIIISEVFDLTLNIPGTIDLPGLDFPEFPDIRAGEKILNTPAARQMLIYRAPNDFSNQTGTDLKQDNHIDFYAEYQAMGLPANCEVYMLTNGSAEGVSGGQEFGPHAELIKFDFSNSDFDDFLVENTGVGWLRFFTGGSIKFNLNALPNYSGVKERIYKGHFGARVLTVVFLSFTHKVVKVKEVYPYDSSPGGVYPLTNIIQHNLATTPILNTAITNNNIAINASGFNFIPTFSGLDLPASYATNPYADLTNLALMNALSPAKRVVLFNGVNSTQGIWFNPLNLNNQFHVSFYDDASQWFNLHLIGNNDINSSATWSSGSYNFGEGNFGPTHNYTNTDFKRTVSHIDNLDHITGNGQVYVNMSNKIGDIGVGLGTYTVLGTVSNPTNFIVSIKPECNQSTKTLLVNNGGLLYIGYGEHHTGEVHLQPGTTLRIGNGGQLYIKPNSKLVVHRGAKLILEHGSFVLNEGSIELQGIYEPGAESWYSGVLEYHDGADIKMEHVNGQIHFKGGDLLVKTGATFSFRHNTGPSGHLRFSIWGKHIFGEANSRIRLKGDGPSDVIVIIEKSSDMWCNSVPMYMKIDNGKVVFDQNARLVSTVPFYSNKVNFEGLTLNRGLALLRTSTIIQANLDEVPIEGLFFYGPTGSLRLYNSTVNNSINDKAIEIKGGFYSISNCVLNANHLYIIKSQNLTATSKLTNSTLNSNHDNGPVTTGVWDNSDAQVTVSTSTMNGNYMCAVKHGGTLRLSCNTFNDFVYAGVGAMLYNNLNMSSGTYGGYNEFRKGNSSAYNVFLRGARELNIHEGYNEFDPLNVNLIPTIYGAMRPLLPMSTISGQANEWNPAMTSPPASFTDIVNELLPGPPPINVDPSAQANGSCGEHYPAGGIGIGGLIGVGLPATRFSFSFGFVGIVDALKSASSYMEELDPQGNNAIAIDMFHEILTYQYGSRQTQVEPALDVAQEYLSQVIRHEFELGNITVDDNTQAFHPSVQLYVEALNMRSGRSVSASNYQRMFSLEMRKAHLFHLLSNRQLAIQLLENAESCGVEAQEHFHINHWKKMLATEQAKIDFGYEAEFIDTTWVDTTGYRVPQPQQSFGDFNSFIQSPQNVNINSCSNNKLLSENANSNLNVNVYPNPAQDHVVIDYTLEGSEQSVFELKNILGQTVQTIKLQEGSHRVPLDISTLSNGPYFYSCTVNGSRVSSGKLVVQ